MFFGVDYCTLPQLYYAQYLQTTWLYDARNKNMPGHEKVIT